MLEKAIQKEKRALIPKVAAMDAPVVRWDGRFDSIRKIRGATYATWFKAAGAFDQRDIGSSPKLLDNEFEDLDYPSVFYSQAVTGKVRWNSYRTRRYLIEHLNVTGFQGNDFRNIYPAWEYVYQLREYIGGVLVKINEYRAASPRRRGWRPS